MLRFVTRAVASLCLHESPTPRSFSGGSTASRVWALLLLLLALLLPRVVLAERPMIPPGREQEILALFEPHALQDELAPGWKLHSFAIDRATIDVWLAGPEGAFAKLTLDHPEYGPEGARQLQGFSLAIVAEPPGSEAAIAELIATIERNDHGQFWQRDVVYGREHKMPPPRELGIEMLRQWALDGLLWLSLFTLVLLVLVVHTLRGSEPWMKWALLAIVAAGVLVRLLLSREIALEVWPYDRFVITANRLFEGPGLALVHPGPVHASEVLTTSTLVLAMMAPPAIFVHARYLLDDHRAALIAAGVIAFLPMHVRFSYSDVAYIPSITASAMLFTLTYVAVRERSQVLGWFAVVSVGLVLAVVFWMRPLNIMHYALLLSAPWVNHGIYSDKLAPNWPRAVVAFVIMTLVTVLYGIPWLLEGYSQQVREGLSFETLISAVKILFSVRMNTLINPEFTPPGLSVLAVFGAVDLWRRGKRRLFSFLVVWLLAGLVAHAYVSPQSEYMQARYHLHLIVPFAMLCACGFEAALRWLTSNRARKPWLTGYRYPAAIALLIAYLCASPLLHARFIRNVETNDSREWLFVHSLREQIPDECTIIEYVGLAAGSRFNRVGTYTVGGTSFVRWYVYPVSWADPDQPPLPDDVLALLEQPPECLYWYEGLPCFGDKRADQAKAPACQAIEELVALEQVASTSFESVPYDENLADGLGDIQQIELTLYRVYPR